MSGVSIMGKKAFNFVSVSLAALLGSAFIMPLASAETIVHTDRSHRKAIFEQDMAAERELRAYEKSYQKQQAAQSNKQHQAETELPQRIEEQTGQEEIAPVVEKPVESVKEDAAPVVVEEPAKAAAAPVVEEKPEQTEAKAKEAAAPVAKERTEQGEAKEAAAPVVEEKPEQAEAKEAAASVVEEKTEQAEAKEAAAPVVEEKPEQGEAKEAASPVVEERTEQAEAKAAAASAVEEKPAEPVQEETAPVVEEASPASFDYVLARYPADSPVVTILAKPDAPVYKEQD